MNPGPFLCLALWNQNERRQGATTRHQGVANEEPGVGYWKRTCLAVHGRRRAQLGGNYIYIYICTWAIPASGSLEPTWTWVIPVSGPLETKPFLCLAPWHQHEPWAILVSGSLEPKWTWVTICFSPIFSPSVFSIIWIIFDYLDYFADYVADVFGIFCWRSWTWTLFRIRFACFRIQFLPDHIMIHSCLVWFPWWLRHGAMDPIEGTSVVG